MRIAATFVLACALGACARAPAPAAPTPPARAPERAELPPPPDVDGPLQIRVAYPDSGARVAARDSNFIFGQTGSGRATLTINGAPVEVAPNGAFLAFLPVPRDGIYRLSATRGTETVTAERRIQAAASPAAGPAGATITSIAPAGALAVRAGDAIEVSVRGTPGARVSVLLPDGTRIPLSETTAPVESDNADNFRTGGAPPARSSGLYRGMVPVTASWISSDTAVARPRLGAYTTRVLQDAVRDSVREREAAAVAAGQGDRVLSPRVQQLRAQLAQGTDTGARIELIAGNDTVRRPFRVNLAVLPRELSVVGVAQPPANAPSDWTVRGRIDVSGPFHYFWLPGTRFQIVGERAGYYRVHLAGDLHAYVPVEDLRLLPAGTPPPGSEIAAVRFNAQSDYVDLRIPLAERLPYRIEETESGLTLDVFGGISQVNYFQYGTLDPLIQRAAWSQPSDSVYRVDVQLSQPVWGYQVLYDRADALILRIRRPPVISADRPFAGLRIVLDPGHPPGGAIGPTGLTEAAANLGVGLALRPLLEAAGAHVIMTRTDNSAVELGARPRMATDSSAHILLSLHNNAFPDGVNPFVNNGTSVYYFHPQSLVLAQHMQAELLQELGLRDIGVGRADLALVRPTWMPAVLTETTFLMVPQQEAAMRNPQVLERVARAHFRALETFLRQRAASQH